MHCQSFNRKSNCAVRPGTTLVEIVVAGILLGTVMSIAVPALSWVVRERRAADRRQQATLEVENLMEQFTARSWDEITQQTAANLELPDQVTQQLPEASLSCTVDSKPETPDSRRIHIELAWSNRKGQTLAPVRLTTWVYRQGRSQ
jgi:type II secretory pathway pseudopilin PulG